MNEKNQFRIENYSLNFLVSSLTVLSFEQWFRDCIPLKNKLYIYSIMYELGLRQKVTCTEKRESRMYVGKEQFQQKTLKSRYTKNSIISNLSVI